MDRAVQMAEDLVDHIHQITISTLITNTFSRSYFHEQVEWTGASEDMRRAIDSTKLTVASTLIHHRARPARLHLLVNLLCSDRHGYSKSRDRAVELAEEACKFEDTEQASAILEWALLNRGSKADVKRCI